MIIIQIRGTSGSSKSTVMRRVLEALGEPEDICWRPSKGKRKLPLYYHLKDGVVILGHYESPCGGCDTIGSARAVYDLIQQVGKERPNTRGILCEGLLLSEDVRWTKQLQEEGHEVRCLFLTTDVEECIRRIKTRRAAVGNAKPLSEGNTRNRVATIERARIKLLERGVVCRRVSSVQAPSVVLNWLRLHAQQGE